MICIDTKNTKISFYRNLKNTMKKGSIIKKIFASALF